MKTDVCLILEGTYPYVFGGVSSWIHKLVRSYPDLTFSIIHISSTGDTLKSPKYEIPSNILEFKEVYIHDFANERSKTFGSKEEGWSTIRKFYEDLSRNDFSNFERFHEKIIDKKTRVLNANDILYSKDAWKLLLEYSNAQAASYSFVDLYWTIRFIHAPILSLFNADIPDASVYHTVCTGYAGLLAVIAKLQKKAPMLLTEHGIYSHERQIEITRAKWLQAGMEDIFRATRSLGFLKDLWIKKFDVLSKLAYRYADEIVTLYEGNRRIQIENGADPEKIKIVPNGIEVPEQTRPPRDSSNGSYSVGFVGRIVPIKDVKTLIRSIKIAHERIRNLRVYILGEGSENPQYVDECKTLTKMLDLEEVIVYTGNVEVKDYYPKLDAVVLTSISEAQPLSLLESMSYGVPVIASDVGACRELVIGKDDADKALGASGLISNVGNPKETADAIVSIVQDSKLWNKMSEAGKKRVKRYYTADKMIDQYRNLYSYFLEKQVLTV